MGGSHSSKVSMPRPHVAFFQMRAYRQALSISFDILQGMILERSSDVTWTLWFASRTITDMASSLPPFQFGPYLTPVISRGARVMCEVRGLVKVVGLSDGPIPWPIGERDRKQALLVYKGLARAVRCESPEIVAAAWGIGINTVRDSPPVIL